MERYGEAIHADLADRGWDLEALWQDRRWWVILNLVDHLPGDSHTVAAMADDDELAAQTPEPEPGPPPLQSWTPEVEKLSLIADRLAEVVTAVHNTVAKKPAKPPPRLPRPETARDRLRRQKRRAKRDLINRRLTQARQAGRPTMADPTPAGPAHAALRPRRRGQTPKEAS